MSDSHVQVVMDAFKKFKAEVIEQLSTIQDVAFTSKDENGEFMAFSLTKAVGDTGGKKAGNYAPLLNAAKVGKKGATVTFKVTGIREPPDNWNAVALLDFEEVNGCGSIALNKTNAGILSAKVGDKVVGRKLTFKVIDVRFGSGSVPGLSLVKIV
jgi:hypothetical protein